MNSTTIAQIRVPFHGAELLVLAHEGQPYTPMKPIVEGMGLDWKAQHAKISGSRFKSTVVEITTVAEDGKYRGMTCLPLRKLPGWLMTIHHNKVRPEIRDKIITYQNECDDALWDYWNKGAAVRQTSTLTKSQIGQLFDVVAKRSGADGQLRHYMWGRLKEHFGPYASYHDIPAGRFEEALQFLLGMSLHGHLQPEAKPYLGRGETLHETVERLAEQLLLPNSYSAGSFEPLVEAYLIKTGSVLVKADAVRAPRLLA